MYCLRRALLSLSYCLIQISLITSYSFPSSIDNLLYIKNSSTLFLISSSHLYQLKWSTNNQSLLLLHRRVQLHSTIDNSQDGVSVFVYDQLKQLLIICARSNVGRCILYDANDITRVYLLDSNLETNYLGCLTGCYTFMSRTNHILRSALNTNRLERNGNIINSQIELGKDHLSYNIKYQLESSDKSLITSLTFLPERIIEKPNYEFIYGFDHEEYTYFVLKSSRLARLCQSAIAMRVTYDEIPLINCQNDNSSIISGAFFPLDKQDNLFVTFSDHICMYSMEEIRSAFDSSKVQCQNGFGSRLDHIIDSTENRARCEKILEQNTTIDQNQCSWQAYRTNTYMDGLIGAQGELIYQTDAKHVRIEFIFVDDNLLILSTNERKIFKLIRVNQTKFYLLHEAIYQNEPFNQQYAIDYEHQSLIFAVHSELHLYAYNSCSLYDTCQTCMASRRYDQKACSWSDGKCSLAIADSIRGCPPVIERIQPMNISVNTEHVRLTIQGAFHDVNKRLVKISVHFPQNQSTCTIEELDSTSLTCNLTVPRQAIDGNISVEIQSNRKLSIGDTDISGAIQFQEKFQVYTPRPILRPDYGPVAGGTKIRIENLAFDLPNNDFRSSMKIFLGKKPCPITEIDSKAIECINQACSTLNEQLEVSIVVNDQPWSIERTFFHCRNNPIIYDWSPKTSIMSGGFELIINGNYLNNIQNPLMKFVSNNSDYEFSSICTEITRTQMICHSPVLSKALEFHLPMNFHIHFLMDNLQIIPDENILTIVNDPIYHPFVDFIQEINSTNIIHFEGKNLSSSHTIDLINVRIDNENNACLPFNLTKTSLDCLISKPTLNNLKISEELDVEIQIGRNLTFLIGKIFYRNSTNVSVRYITKQIASWTVLILLILTSITILTLIFFIALFLRRRYFCSSEKSSKPNQPPSFYHDVWCELGKKWQINIHQLKIGDKIGQGCFGDVYRGEYKTPTNELIEVAIKVLRDQNIGSMHEFLFEANRMKDFSHPNILSLIGVGWDPIRKALVLLPYMTNGDLRSYILNEKNRPTVRQLITWGIEIADGMEYLSSLKFVHRDLATRNCMLDENLVCHISDFGLSRDVFDKDYYLVPRTTVTKEKNGQIIQIPPRRLPIRWLSPESIESSKYTIQSDVWSYGVLLWELLSRGKTPYPGIDNADVYSYVKNGYRLPQPTYCPPLLYKSAMILCWHADPMQRPTFAQLARDIRHILHQLELAQEQHRLSSLINDDDGNDGTLVVERKLKRLSTTSMSSASSLGGQYITTPYRQPENVQFGGGDDEDAYAVAVNSSAEVFSTTRLLPKYTETSISEEA